MSEKPDLHYRPLGPAYPERVKKSQRNQIGWGIFYMLAGGAMLYVGTPLSVAWPAFALGAVTFVIADSLGKGRSNVLRVFLGLALVGLLLYFAYGVAVMYVQGAP